eukprot:scaffold247_cov274-Pinguiococcus_pyrenoidosus.AAC.4
MKTLDCQTLSHPSTAIHVKEKVAALARRPEGPNSIHEQRAIRTQKPTPNMESDCQSFNDSPSSSGGCGSDSGRLRLKVSRALIHTALFFARHREACAGSTVLILVPFRQAPFQKPCGMPIRVGVPCVQGRGHEACEVGDACFRDLLNAGVVCIDWKVFWQSQVAHQIEVFEHAEARVAAAGSGRRIVRAAA